MKMVLVINDDQAKKTLPLKMRKGYEDLYDYFFEKGIILCRAPVIFFDKERKFFKEAQFFEKGKWIWKKNIKPDVVYDKTPFYLDKKTMDWRKEISKNFSFVNDLGLSEIFSNKWLTYKKFHSFSPKAVLIEKKEDLEKAKELLTKKIILKPITGSGGKGIVICDKDKIKSVDFPFLAQEMIDSEKGITGIVNTPHDLRVVISNEKPFYAFLRIPKKGELISNLSRGGKIEAVEIEKLPKSLFEIMGFVWKKLSRFENKFYSIDFIFFRCFFLGYS